jgi:hypothetical protein
MCSLIAVTFLIFGTRYSAEVAKYALKTSIKQSPLICPSTSRNDSTWQFEAKRDGNNHGLSEEQCRSAFPKLFVEIDKSASVRENNHIQFKDVDGVTVEDGMVRGIIDQGEVGSSKFLDDWTPLLTFLRRSCISLISEQWPPHSRGAGQP